MCLKSPSRLQSLMFLNFLYRIYSRGKLWPGAPARSYLDCQIGQTFDRCSKLTPITKLTPIYITQLRYFGNQNYLAGWLVFARKCVINNMNIAKYRNREIAQKRNAEILQLSTFALNCLKCCIFGAILCIPFPQKIAKSFPHENPS